LKSKLLFKFNRCVKSNLIASTVQSSVLASYGGSFKTNAPPDLPPSIPPAPQANPARSWVRAHDPTWGFRPAWVEANGSQ